MIKTTSRVAEREGGSSQESLHIQLHILKDWEEVWLCHEAVNVYIV